MRKLASELGPKDVLGVLSVCAASGNGNTHIILWQKERVSKMKVSRFPRPSTAYGAMGGVLASPVWESVMYDCIDVIACVNTKIDRNINTVVRWRSH